MSAPAWKRRWPKSTKYANDIAKKDNDEALAGMKATGKTEFYQPTPAERETLCKAMAPVYTEMADRVGKDLIASVQKEVGFAVTKVE